MVSFHLPRGAEKSQRFIEPQGLAPIGDAQFRALCRTLQLQTAGETQSFVKKTMDTPKRGGRFSHVIWKAGGKQLGDKEINSVNLCIRIADGTWISHFWMARRLDRTVYYSGRPTVKWNGAQRPSELNCGDSERIASAGHEIMWPQLKLSIVP